MPVSKLSDDVLRAIDALIEARVAKAPVPGVAVGIVQGDGLVAFLSHGAADLESGEAPTGRSIARVASVTKTLTATAIMQLRDASLLELDDPLLLHLPEFTNAQAVAAPLEAVTIRRLLTHYSGLASGHPDLYWYPPEFPTGKQLMDSLDKVQVVIPEDSQWKYSNLAYSLLGEVISRLSGKRYVDYVLDEIIRPLGMENTAFDLSPEQEKLRMTGYNPPLPGDSDFRLAPYGHLNGFTSAGQLQTNIEDLAKWLSFQFGNGPESVLSKQSRAEMQRPVYIDGDWSSGQCIGWRAVRKGDHVFHNHGGAIHGFATSVFFNVLTKTGVVVLVNMWPTAWNADLALSIAGQVAGAIEPASSVATSQTPATELSSSEYDGKYFAEPSIKITIATMHDGPVFLPPAADDYVLHAPAKLQATAEPDSFKVVGGRGAGELAVFERNEKNEVTGFTLEGFDYRKLD